MENSCDIIVIGGGPAGYAAALRAAASAQKVALIEKEGLGGICLLAGCIPTKIFSHHLRLLHKIKNKENFGIKIRAVDFSLEKMVAQKDEKIAAISLNLENLFKKNKIELIKGNAVLTGPGEITVNNGQLNSQKITASKIILATGSQPVIPENFSFDGQKVITSTEALNLKEIPKKIIIIGGGAIGVEWATIYSILGSEVILLEALDQILPGVESDIVRPLLRQFEKHKIKISTGALVEKIVSDSQAAGQGLNSPGVKVYLKSGEILEANQSLIALGRKGNIPPTENFKFKEEKSFLAIDSNLQTSVPDIYAAGDLTGPPLLAHRASWQGKKLAEFLSGQISKIPTVPIPYCVFSFLEIASVGLTQKEAEEKNLDFGVVRLPFGTLGIARVYEESDGQVKVIFEKSSKKILGIHLAGEYASFILGQAVTLLNTGATLETLENLMQAHPTYAEILGSLPEFYWT